jgi:RND family efflux transporter MFP subunit
MASGDFGGVVKGVETLLKAGTVAGLTDLQLLERFAGRSDDGAEAAFAALVKRHGPMVLRVCRGVLQDTHAAEDAFQATFLILARQTRSIRKGGSLASWLYGVARRVAGRARVDRARRAARERRGAAMAECHECWQDGQPDLVPEIQEEVDRLPEKYRAPIVLCYLEGLTHEEAASQLRVPVGTVKVRLSRGRERLRGRLVRRGLAPTLIAAALAAPTRAAVPAQLLDLTVETAMHAATVGAVGISAYVAALAEGVLRAMFLNELKTIAALVATSLTLLLTSFLVVATWPPPVRSDQDPAPSQEKAQVPAAAQTTAPQPPGESGGVAVVTLKKSIYARTTIQPGTVQAFNSVELYPRVSGGLASLSVDIGDQVKRGQVLAEIDAPELHADVEKGKALLKRAKARLARVQSAVRVAEATSVSERAKVQSAEADLKNSEAALLYREKQLKRMTELAQRNAVGQNLVDEQAQGFEAAKASCDAAQAQVALARAGLGGAEAKIEAARAEVEEARAEFAVAVADLRKFEVLDGLTRVSSPLDGVVTRRGYHVGDFVRSPKDGDSVPLLSIVQMGKVRIIIQVPDQDATLLDIGDPATFRADALSGRESKGAISRMAVAEDLSSRTLRAEIDLDNTDGRMRPGQLGVVEIQLENPHLVLGIPRTALIALGGGTDGPVGCFRTVKGRAVETPITIGSESLPEGRVEVLEGLKEGDVVIVDPRRQKIREGQVIEADRTPRVQ